MWKGLSELEGPAWEYLYFERCQIWFQVINKFIFVKTNFNLEQKSVKTEEKQHLILKDSILQLQGLLPLLKHTWIVHLLHTRSHKDKSP